MRDGMLLLVLLGATALALAAALRPLSRLAREVQAHRRDDLTRIEVDTLPADLRPRAMRFVAFEGGGDASQALQGWHVGVFPGDAAEALQAIAGGAALRLLAVLAGDRLDAGLTDVPTSQRPASRRSTWSGRRCMASVPAPG